MSTEKELMEQLTVANRELADAKRGLAEAKKRWTDAETKLVDAKCTVDKVTEQLRVLRAAKVIPDEHYASYDDE